MLFKRLFIGLLILSALTAEGTAFFNTALAPLQNYMAGLYSEEDEKDLVTADGSPKGIGLIPVRYGIYAFIPMDEIVKARDKQNEAFCFLYAFSDPLCPVVTRQAQKNTIFFQYTGIILQGSDISPPAVL